MLPVLNAWHNLLLSRPIAGKLIGDHDARRPALPLQQFTKQALGGALITPVLNQHIEDLAFMVDGAPPIHPLAGIHTAISSRCQR